MTKRTLSKKMRTKHLIAGYREGIQKIEEGKPVIGPVPILGKVAGYIPAPALEMRDVRYGMHVMKVRVAPGQVINLKKEFKRQRAAELRGESSFPL